MDSADSYTEIPWRKTAVAHSPLITDIRQPYTATECGPKAIANLTLRSANATSIADCRQRSNDAVWERQTRIDDLRKSRGLHSVRAFGNEPVYIGPCLRV